MNFQGRLADASGNIKPNATYNMRLKLYTVDTAGSPVWSEDRLVSSAQGVAVTNGLFSIQLGSVTSLPSSLFAGGALYLEVELPTPASATTSSPVWSEGPMTPRNQMATSAYAYNAEMLDGQDGSYYQDASNLNAGTVNSARLSGSYGGITGTGALSVGSIGTGFGTIVTGNTIQGSQFISTVPTGTAPIIVASTTLISNLNADLLDGQTASFYQNAANITAGTLDGARLSGSYAGITGVGALTSGSIAAGFGTIVTGNIITGTTLNGTTGINTGPGAGTQRIDANGDLTNIGTVSASGTIATSGVVTQGGYQAADAATNSMLVNGDFERNNATGWTGVTDVVSGGYSGDYTSRFVGPRTLESVDYIPVDPIRDVLQLEVYVKKSVAGVTPGTLYFGYKAYDANKTVIGTAPCGSYCYFAAAATTVPVDGNWHKYSATTTGEGTAYPNFPVGTKYVRVLGLINYSASADAVTLVDHISLKRINNGPLFVGNNFSATNMVDQHQQTQLYTTNTNVFTILAPSSGDVNLQGGGLQIGGTNVITSGRALQNVTTISASSTITGSRLISTVATGTAPLTVSSTTKVTSLNVDLLDGLDSTSFASASGSANYIQNTSTQQAAYFNISGNGVIGGSLTVQNTYSSNLTVNGTMWMGPPGADNGVYLCHRTADNLVVRAWTGCSTASSIRYKENVTSLGASALDLIGQLRPVSFDWKAGTGTAMNGSIHDYGLIAEEVRNILPNVVAYGADGQVSGLNYQGFIPFLMQAIKEQQSQIVQLQGGNPVYSSLAVNGLATVKELVVTGDAHVQGDIYMDGHLVSGGNTPTIDASLVTCLEDIALSGTDTAGTLRFRVNAAGCSAADVRVTFAKAYSTAPHATLTAKDRASAHVASALDADTRTMTFSFDELLAGKTYRFTYHVIQ